MIPEDYLEDILHFAAESGKALEINRCDFSDPVYLDFLRRMCSEKIIFSVGSDAHSTAAVAVAKERTARLETLGFEENHHWRPRI